MNINTELKYYRIRKYFSIEKSALEESRLVTIKSC
jgi:hypothetical protein